MKYSLKSGNQINMILYIISYCNATYSSLHSFTSSPLSSSDFSFTHLKDTDGNFQSFWLSHRTCYSIGFCYFTEHRFASFKSVIPSVLHLGSISNVNTENPAKTRQDVYNPRTLIDTILHCCSPYPFSNIRIIVLSLKQPSSLLQIP